MNYKSNILYSEIALKYKKTGSLIMVNKIDKITIEVIVAAPIAQIWKAWTSPVDITQWNFASDDWCCPAAINDFKIGGHFSFRMEAKDNSFGFDFSGMYITIQEHKSIKYLMDDGRSAEIIFEDMGYHTRIVQSFEAETTNPIEMQKNGWQAILNNFKRHIEVISL